MTNTNNTKETPTKELTAPKSGEIEIDLLELARKLWDNRKFILKVTAIFAAIGLFVAIFSPKEYTSKVVLIPQTGDEKSKVGNLAGLAAMAGVNLNSIGGSSQISPTIYTRIISNVEFQKELMYSKIYISYLNKYVTLYDFFNDDNYRQNDIFFIIKKYTIGLPGFILKKIKTQEKNVRLIDKKLLFLKKSEFEVSKILSNRIELSYVIKENTILINGKMPDPIAAEQLVENVRGLLQKYLIEYKITRAKQNLVFVYERYKEAKNKFEAIQNKLASYRDGNRNVILSSVKLNEEKLLSDYNLSYSVYSELAKQLEQYRIQVKESQPVLSVIEPSFVPITKSEPNRPLIVFIFIFLGFVVSLVVLFSRRKCKI